MCFGVILESKFSPFVDVSHPDSLESQSIRNRFVTLSRLIVTELASQKKKKKNKKCEISFSTASYLSYKTLFGRRVITRRGYLRV